MTQKLVKASRPLSEVRISDFRTSSRSKKHLTVYHFVYIWLCVRPKGVIVSWQEATNLRRAGGGRSRALRSALSVKGGRIEIGFSRDQRSLFEKKKVFFKRKYLNENLRHILHRGKRSTIFFPLTLFRWRDQLYIPEFTRELRFGAWSFLAPFIFFHCLLVC